MTKSKDELIKKAQDLYFGHSETRYIPTIKAYEELITAFPDNLEAYNMKATMHKCIGEYDEALQTYDAALEVEKNDEIIASKILTLTKLHRMIFSAPYYVDKNHVDLPYHIINYAGGQDGVRRILLTEIEALMQKEIDENKRYDLKVKKARVLEKLNLTTEAIQAYKDCLTDIPEQKLNSFMNPIEIHNKTISRLYKGNGDYALALDYLNIALEGKSLDSSAREKIEPLKKLGRPEKADQFFKQIIAAVRNLFHEKKDMAYIIQQINLSLNYNRISVAKEAFELFNDLEQLNEYQQKLKREFAEKIKNFESPSDEKTLSSTIQLKELTSEKIQLQNYKYQWAGEFIHWYHPLGQQYDVPKLLEGMYDVLHQLIEFPVAEYNGERDIMGLFGACLGEVFRQEFKWHWKLASDYEKGIVGPIIISPDDRFGILTNEYIRQRKNDDSRDELKLYDHFKNNKPIPKNLGLVVLGDWKEKKKFEELF